MGTGAKVAGARNNATIALSAQWMDDREVESAKTVEGRLPGK